MSPAGLWSSRRPGLTDLALVWIFKAHVWGKAGHVGTSLLPGQSS